MPTDGPALPHPKAQALARGERKYRRRVASPKRWAAIIEAKRGPCRCCCDPASNGSKFSLIQFHHIVARVHGGDDCEDNIAPLCPECHANVTARDEPCSRGLLEHLTDAEYAYMIARGGEGYPERAYGVRYER